MKMQRTSVQVTEEQREFLTGYRGLTFSEAIRFILECEMEFKCYQTVKEVRVMGPVETLRAENGAGQ